MNSNDRTGTRTMPTGTLTFLFTDVEGSTRLWEQYPDQTRRALVRHDELIEHLVAEHHGVVVKPRGEGDSRFAVFEAADAAVCAACEIQLAFLAEQWPTPSPLHIRIALHTGLADLRDNDYYGSDVNRCARLRATAHGGQVVLSARTAEQASPALPHEISLQGLGQHRLKDLGQPERIYQLLHPDLPARFPPLKSLSSLLNNLPVELTSFVGREWEIAEIKRLVRSERLLTLVGAGGAGKTRLGLHVAAEVLDDFDDGVWLVELASLTDSVRVAEAVASVLGVREEPGRPLVECVFDTLRPKQAMILLDNCEHLLRTCAQLVDSLLRACPHVRILATSREALRIPSEIAWRVPSLSLPEGDLRAPSMTILQRSDAVRLFLERAAAMEPVVALTERDAPAVLEICRRLDGIPLALELAAARIRVLTSQQIASRLADRFRLLTEGSRVAPSRQQTLRALVDWSYDLLSEMERTMFGRLAVFAGGLDLDSAEAVCAGDGIRTESVLQLVSQLVDKSLVLAEPASGGSMRYRLLETLRQYGRERLAESGDEARVRHRHADHFLAIAERAEPELNRPAQLEWLKRLDVEHDNLTAAMAEGAERPAPEIPVRFVTALWRFWELHGHLTEGRAYAERALAAHAELPARLRAAVLLRAGVLAWRQGDHEQAQRRLEESLALNSQLGDTSSLALVLNNLGNVAWANGEYVQARSRYEQSLALRRELGELAGVASCLNNLGIVASDRGDYADAWARHEEALELRRGLGHQGGVAQSLQNLGEVALRRGDYREAKRLYNESLTLFRDLGERVLIARNLEALARLAEAASEPRRAARLFGASAALRDRTKAPLELTDKATYQRSLFAVRLGLSDQAFNAAWAEGGALPLPAAIDEALGTD